jgi:hypothetical protein
MQAVHSRDGRQVWPCTGGQGYAPRGGRKSLLLLARPSSSAVAVGAGGRHGFADGGHGGDVLPTWGAVVAEC